MHINSPKNEVFKALTETDKLSKWYTTIVKGVFKLDEIITFEFVNFAEFKFRVVSLTKDESVHLEINNYLNFIKQNIEIKVDENLIESTLSNLRRTS